MTSRGSGALIPFDDDMEEHLLLVLVGVGSDSDEDVEDAEDGLDAGKASTVIAGDCGGRWGVKEFNAAGAEATESDDENDDAVSGVLGRSNDDAEVEEWSALGIVESSVSRSFPFLLRPALYAANSFICCIFSVVSRSLMLTTREDLDGVFSPLDEFKDNVTPAVIGISITSVDGGRSIPLT